MVHSELPSNIRWLCERDLLLPLAEQYVKECKEKEGKGRFPNLAGFCRSIGGGLFSLDSLRHEYFEQYSALCALLEDEALNSNQSATVLSAYMKEHLGFGEVKKEKEGSLLSGDIKLIFEHDVIEDGG